MYFHLTNSMIIIRSKTERKKEYPNVLNRHADCGPSCGWWSAVAPGAAANLPSVLMFQTGGCSICIALAQATFPNGTSGDFFQQLIVFRSYHLTPEPQSPVPATGSSLKKKLSFEGMDSKARGDFKRRVVFFWVCRAASLKACGCLKKQGTARSDFPPMWSQQ